MSPAPGRRNLSRKQCRSLASARETRKTVYHTVFFIRRFYRVRFEAREPGEQVCVDSFVLTILQTLSTIFSF